MIGNMPTENFCHSFKIVAAPGIFIYFLAVCSDFPYIAQKGVAVHFFIRDKYHIFCVLDYYRYVLATLQWPGDSVTDDAS